MLSPEIYTRVHIVSRQQSARNVMKKKEKKLFNDTRMLMPLR